MSNIFKKINSIDPIDTHTDRLETRAQVHNMSASAPISNTSDVPTRVASFPTAILPEEHTRKKPVQIDTDTPFNWMPLAMITAIILWLTIAGLLVYVMLDIPNRTAPFSTLDITLASLFVVAPLSLILITIYACHQLSRLSREANLLRQTADDLLTPDDTVVLRSQSMGQKIRRELIDMQRSTDALLSRAGELQTNLNGQVEQINQTSYILENRAGVIASRLSEERHALDNISQTFTERLEAMSVMLDQQNAQLLKSTEDAHARMEDTRASVESMTENITHASKIMHDQTMETTHSLATNHDDITQLAAKLNERAQDLDKIYSKHAKTMAEMISTLKSEQQSMGEQLDIRLKRMQDMSDFARDSANHLATTGDAGREAVKALSQAAKVTDATLRQRFADMENMVRYSNSRAESISETAARRVQESLQHTRKEIARIEDDMAELQETLHQSTRRTDNQAYGSEVLPDTVKDRVSERIDSERINSERIDNDTSSEAQPTAQPLRRGLNLKPFADDTVAEDVLNDEDVANRISPEPLDVSLDPQHAETTELISDDIITEIAATETKSEDNAATKEDVGTPLQTTIKDADDNPSHKQISNLADTLGQQNENSPKAKQFTSTDELSRSLWDNRFNLKLSTSSDVSLSHTDGPNINSPKLEAAQNLSNTSEDIEVHTVSDDEPPRRIAPEQDMATPPSKPWWRRLFGGNRDNDTLAIDQITAKAEIPKSDDEAKENVAARLNEISKSGEDFTLKATGSSIKQPIDRDKGNEDEADADADSLKSVIGALVELGLSPNAVVDDGCILDAVAIRVTRGAKDMSKACAARLGEPILHLRAAMASDPELKTRIIRFAREFHVQLTAINADRDYLQARLQSETGRAFLLCDAALNT